MLFDIDDEMIRMIAESARRIADCNDLGRIRALRYAMPGFDRAHWREMCELGWPALRVPEDRGGVGLGIAAYCTLTHELGAGLLPEPLIDTSLAAALLDGEALRAHLAGDSLVLPAWQDTRDAAVPTQALAEVDGRLHGVKYHVVMAAGADAFLAIGPEDAWLVDAADPGVSLVITDTQDGGHAATVSFDGARGRRFAVDPGPALGEACLATSAYLVGLAGAALGHTVTYLGVRKQFGKAIGAFQALQHQAVELKLALELARASTADAASKWEGAPGSASAFAAVSRAKVSACKAASLVTRGAIQLHGGIGFTDEHDIGLYLRKAMVMAPRFGSVALHCLRYRELSPEGHHE